MAAPWGGRGHSPNDVFPVGAATELSDMLDEKVIAESGEHSISTVEATRPESVCSHQQDDALVHSILEGSSALETTLELQREPVSMG